MYPKLQYISQGLTPNEHLNSIRSVLDVGCLWVQLRMKNFSLYDIETTANKVKSLCNHYHATFILNDHITIAKQCDADGVHLGLTDDKIAVARNLLGDNKLIGGTANTLNDVIQRIDEKCDYIGLGPYRHTITKENLSPVLGIDGYKMIISNLNHVQLKTPIYAIGGIEIDDVADLINANIHGIAVSGTLTNAKNKKEMMNQFNTQLHKRTI